MTHTACPGERSGCRPYRAYGGRGIDIKQLPGSSFSAMRPAQIPLALWVMATPELATNRLIGRTPTSLLMLTISAGYFLYDAVVSILRYEGLAYLLHGVVSCVLYTYGALTGFLSYYGAQRRAKPALGLYLHASALPAGHLGGQ